MCSIEHRQTGACFLVLIHVGKRFIGRGMHVIIVFRTTLCSTSCNLVLLTLNTSVGYLSVQIQSNCHTFLFYHTTHHTTSVFKTGIHVSNMIDFYKNLSLHLSCNKCSLREQIKLQTYFNFFLEFFKRRQIKINTWGNN